MKIVIINSIYWPNTNGGSQVSTRILAECLSKKGHDVNVITQGNKDETIYKDNYTIHYIRPSKTPFIDTLKWNKIKKLIWNIKDLYDINTAQRIYSLISQIKPDIVHTNCIQGFSCVLWKYINQLGIPIIHTLRDYYLICIHSLQKYGVSCNGQCTTCQTFNFTKKALSKYVNGVIGVSSFILNIHIQNGYFQNTRHKSVIPNPFITTNYKKTNSNIVRFGFIGRIVKAKGLELALDSFSRIKDTSIEFYIAGNGDEKYISELKNKYTNPRIIFLGFQESSVFFQKIDILVIPSIWPEPFGRVAIEAAAQNVYPLVANSGGLIDIVNELKYGRIFKKEIKDDLYKQMTELILNREYRQSISTDKLLKYSPETVTELYINAYKETINKHTR